MGLIQEIRLEIQQAARAKAIADAKKTSEEIAKEIGRAGEVGSAARSEAVAAAAKKERQAWEPVRRALKDDIATHIELGRTVDATNAKAVAGWQRQAQAIRVQAHEVGLSRLEILRMDSALVGVERNLARASQAGGRGGAGGGFLGQILGIAGGFGVFATAQGLFRGVVSFFNDAADAADNFAAAQRKVLAVSKLTGVAVSEIAAINRQAADTFLLGVQRSADFTQQIVKLTGRAGDVSQSLKLMGAWLDLAAAQGLNADEALQTLTTTLIEQDEGLNRLGLANPSQIYAKWAASLHTTVANMTQAQKAQAIINEVVQNGNRVHGEYVKTLDTAAGRSQRLNQETQAMLATWGKGLSPMRDFFNALAREGVSALTKVGDLWTKTFSPPSLEDQINQNEALLGRYVAQLQRAGQDVQLFIQAARHPGGGIGAAGLTVPEGGQMIPFDLQSFNILVRHLDELRTKLKQVRDAAATPPPPPIKPPSGAPMTLDKEIDLLVEGAKHSDTFAASIRRLQAVEADLAAQRGGDFAKQIERAKELARVREALGGAGIDAQGNVIMPPITSIVAPLQTTSIAEQVAAGFVGPNASGGPPGGRFGTTFQEHFKQLFDGVRENARNAAEGMADAFSDAFRLIFEDIKNTDAAFSHLGKGLARAILGELAGMARGKAAANIASAIEEVAAGFAASANPFFAESAAKHFAAAEKYALAAVKWGILAGGAGALMPSQSGGGGGAGGAGGTTPGGGAQPTNRAPDIHIHVDGVDPKNPRHAELVGQTAAIYEELTGGRILLAAGGVTRMDLAGIRR